MLRDSGNIFSGLHNVAHSSASASNVRKCFLMQSLHRLVGWCKWSSSNTSCLMISRTLNRGSITGSNDRLDFRGVVVEVGRERERFPRIMVLTTEKIGKVVHS